MRNPYLELFLYFLSFHKSFFSNVVFCFIYSNSQIRTVNHLLILHTIPLPYSTISSTYLTAFVPSRLLSMLRWPQCGSYLFINLTAESTEHDEWKMQNYARAWQARRRAANDWPIKMWTKQVSLQVLALSQATMDAVKQINLAVSISWLCPIHQHPPVYSVNSNVMFPSLYFYRFVLHLVTCIQSFAWFVCCLMRLLRALCDSVW